MVTERGKDIEMEYRITADRWGQFRQELERLARRAQQWSGFEGQITFETETVEEVEWTCAVRDFNGQVHGRAEHIVGATHEEQNCPFRVHQIVVVQLESQPIQLMGWEFLARQVREGGTVVLNVVPGSEGQVPAWARETSPDRCDHCMMVRRRNDTFLVRNVETGQVMQVGSTCLRDFLGHDPQRIARLLETLGRMTTRLEGCLGGYGAEPYGVSLRDFLAQTAAQIRETGWVSRTSARANGGTATADLAWNAFTGDRPAWIGGRRSPNRFPTPQEQDFEQADNAIIWARECDPSDNDYIANIRSIAEAGWVTFRLAGYAGSIPAASQRDAVRAQERQQAEEDGQDLEYVGIVDQRQEFALSVMTVRQIETAYGTSTLYKFRDENGNHLTTFASTPLPAVAERDVVRLKGTVKKHAKYQGVRETTLNRCTVIEIVSEGVAS